MMNPMAFSNELIAKTLNLARTTVDTKFFDASEARVEQAAQFAAPAAAGVGLLLAIIAAIKSDSFSAFLYGAAWVLVVAVAYYIGSHFLEVCKRSIKNNPSTISTGEYLETLGLMALLVLIGVVVGSVIMAVKSGSIRVFEMAIPMAVVLLACVGMFLNPKLITTEVKATAIAGEDALTVMVALYKSAVKLAGIVFGTLVTVGALVMLIEAIYLIKDNVVAAVVGQGLMGFAGTKMILVGLLFPFAIYVGFIVFHLTIDLCRAILSLSKK